MTTIFDDKETNTAPPRTRFAPSPTGSLHIGGARTALFNYLFARGGGGQFILRIDDTDAERSEKIYESEIMNDLRWLGIDWDEGPYRQSERNYDEWVEKLLASGAAYPCYCSQERIDSLRATQAAAGLPPKYDGKCKNLREKQSGSFCVRFAMPHSVTLRDLLRGEHTLHDVGDFIIRRSNGAPVYLFTSVIDDYLMKITHVIRGDEHLPNAVRQLAMFDALGMPAPVFAHIPMILGADRHKLSKRTGSLPISHYRERGFSPAAMCAYLATLSHPEIGGENVPNMDELARNFSLSKISASAPVHDEEHLFFHQRRFMASRNSDEIMDELFLLSPEFEKIASKNKIAFGEFISEMKREYATIFEIRDAISFLIEKPEPHFETWFNELGKELENLPDWGAEPINNCLRTFMKANAMKAKEFFHPLRVSLTGQEKGAPLPLVMSVMGRDECLSRILIKE